MNDQIQINQPIQPKKKVSRLAITSFILSIIATGSSVLFYDYTIAQLGGVIFLGIIIIRMISPILSIISIVFAIRNKEKINYKVSLVLSILGFIISVTPVIISSLFIFLYFLLCNLFGSGLGGPGC